MTNRGIEYKEEIPEDDYKKSICHENAQIVFHFLCPYEDEHTSHIIALFHSYYQRPCGFMLRGRLVFCPLLGKKGGEKNDE